MCWLLNISEVMKTITLNVENQHIDCEGLNHLKYLKLNYKTRTTSEYSKSYLDFVIKNYKFQYPSLKDLKSALSASFLNFITMKTLDKKDVIGLGLLNLGQVFTAEWCDHICLELDSFQAWALAIDLPVDRPNTMNKHGIILYYLGFSLFFDELIRDYILPITSIYYQFEGGDSLDSHHAFTVEYFAGGKEGETELGFHVDDAEVCFMCTLCFLY